VQQRVLAGVKRGAHVIEPEGAQHDDLIGEIDWQWQ
jgi:hypothetical protein